MNRKEMKRCARAHLKRHYLVYVVIGLISLALNVDYLARLRGSDNTGSFYSAEIEDSTAGETADGADPGTERAVQNGPRGLYDVIAEMIVSGGSAAAQMSQEIKAEQIAGTEEKAMLGRSEGVFASLVNNITSGSFVVTLATSLSHLIGAELASVVIVMALAWAIKAVYWILVVNAYRIVLARLYVEGRIYGKLPIHRFLYLIRQKMWLRGAWIMLVEAVYTLLWNCTIIGGLVKHCSYFMVPYIAAENPQMKANEVITLSRKMMQGHKWECAKLELSFLGWYLLDLFAYGILKVLFVFPYMEAAKAEYAVYIRSCAIESGIAGIECLNDRYLYKKADADLLRETYQDVIGLTKDDEHFVDQRKGLRKAISDYFGIILINDAREKAYQDHQARVAQYEVLKDASDGNAYPLRLSPLPNNRRYDRRPVVRYTRAYSIWTLLVIFLTMSFAGWLWEVSLHLAQDGVFVNRGILHGPWLPIYGTGCIIILVLLFRFRRNPVLELAAAVIVCGILEYSTAWYLEVTHDGQKWWDYTGYFLNLHGRICAEGLLVFGLGGMTIVYLIAPNLAYLTEKVRRRILIPLVLILMLICVADQVYSSKHPNTGEGITDYGTSAAVAEAEAGTDAAGEAVEAKGGTDAAGKTAETEPDLDDGGTH